ncbi:MAG: class I SAM-dependent methyltransferase [Thermoplasmata archaeon]|nr:class I SAM-dependent methyltransferase [Thermoplasmata archaeon]MCI4356099.1 class I SAM-dependent methyltransferase [Thermoplasmata archaeon]
MHAESDPDGAWVRALTGAPAVRSEAAVAEARAEARLFRHISREHAREGRESYGEIAAPLELYALVRLLRPRHVVEVGVSSGVSSAYLLAALERNRQGTLHSVDRPKRPVAPKSNDRARSSWSLPAGRWPGWAVPASLRPRWDLRVGDKALVLPLLAEELNEVGLFVYDVPHHDRAARGEFRRIGARMPTGAVAISDHGTPGEECRALARWARDEGRPTSGRAGSGLFAFAKG